MLAFLVGIAGSLFGWYQARTAQQGRDIARVHRYIQRTHLALVNRMESYENLLRTVGGVLSSGAQIRAKDWESLATHIDFQRLPGLKSLARIVVVPKAGIASFLERGKKEGVEYYVRRMYRVSEKPDLDRYIEDASDYYLIQYLVPRNMNPSGMGIDIGSNPIQRQAADLARDSGQPTLSGKLIFTSEEKSSAAVGLFLPIYSRNGYPDDTPEKRRALSDGWLSAGLVLQHLFDDLTQLGDDRLAMEVYDIHSGLPQLLYRDARLPEKPPDLGLGPFPEQVRLAQRTWQIRYHILPAFLSSPGRTMGHPWLIGGVFVSLLLAASVYSLVSARDRAVNLAQRMTIDLKEALQRFHSHLNQTPLAAIEWDLQGNIRDWNPAAEQIFGYPKETILGRNAALLEPGNKGELMRGLQQALTEKRGRESVELMGKDKQIIPCICHHTAITDIQGKTTGILSLLEDQTEIRKIEEALQISQKMESLGVLAGGIAHEFNNMMTAVGGNAELAMRNKDCRPVHVYLERILTTAHRAGDLARQMLAYAGRAPVVIENLDLHHELQISVELLRASLPKHIKIELLLDPQTIYILGDKTQIKQILINLVTNAADAIQNRSGMIRIHTSRLEITEELRSNLWPSQDIPLGPGVCLSIEDNGCGMSKEMLSRIFDPFFTTKFAGRGLGLPAMLGNLKRHSAGLSVESRLNEGTTFHLYFPESIKEFAASRPEKEKEGTDRRGTILFADDESLMREMITEALVPLGYTVLLAKDGVEAVEMYRAHREILLTILDVTMPRMGGMEAFQAIRHISPKAQVVLGSGYFEPGEHNEGQMVPDAFLSKPFRIKELCDTIDRLCSVGKVSPE